MCKVITEWKGKASDLTAQQLEFNRTVQHYRGRVEHVIREVVDGRQALCTRWRGSFALLAAILKIAVHMVGLQERMKGPRYDVLARGPCVRRILRRCTRKSGCVFRYLLLCPHAENARE